MIKVINDNDWNSFNKTDVREEVIAPLLRRLGYQTGSESTVIREQELRYEKSQLGRKNPKKDWPLRGKADYTCEAKGRIRWTIEAKSPSKEISFDDIEQAYTYARHPEVRGVYFCVCNGREFKVYSTVNAPESDPILSLKYSDLEGSFHAIESLLSPNSILKDHPSFIADFGKPIGPGLRSVVRITSGHIVFQTSNPPLPVFNGYTIFIKGGAVQHDESGCLRAFLHSLVPHESLQKLNERLGLASFEVISKDAVVSTEKSRPTTFVSSNTIHLARGEKIYDFTTGTDVVLPSNLTCRYEVSAQGILDKTVFVGKFQVKYHYLEYNFNLLMDGKFELHLA